MIVPLEELAAPFDRVRPWRRLVLAHGVWDVLHLGHVRHLEAAKKLGDLLCVTVTPDRHVNKGPGRPAFPEDVRAEVLAALRCVDRVAINRWPSAVETIRFVRPDIFVKGGQYQGQMTDALKAERDAVEAVGGVLEYTHDPVVFSSTAILEGRKYVKPQDVYTEVAQ